MENQQAEKPIQKTKRTVVPTGEQLFPYQREGVRALIKRERSLLADEPGLGKTCQAVVCANVWLPQHVVVICPAVVRSTWQYEWERWSLLQLPLLVVTSGKQCVPPDTRVIIISYDLASTPKWSAYLTHILKSSSLSMLICDEAHALKSWKAKRTRTILKDISPHADRLLLLTGTPMTNSITDLHPLFSSCDPRNWGKFKDFCYKYSYPFPTPYGSGIEFRGTKNVPELRRLASDFMVRRFKKDVLTELPEKLYSTVYLSLPATVGTIEGTPEEIASIQNAIENNQEVNIPSNMAQMRQLIGLSKLPAISAWLDNFLESSPNEPLVVFAHHKAVVAQLIAYFTSRDISVCSITGATPHAERARNIADFQDGKKQVIVLSIMAAGVGITLTTASTCIFAELDWSPTVLSQCIDRLHRIGQVKNVQIFFLLAEDSIDSQLINVIKRKLVDMTKLLGKE